jgi:membrane protease subunit (stomatin/prohibitin family)
LEFDRAMGKLSAKDFDEMAGRLRARAISLIKQLDSGGSGYRAVIERELSARLQGRAPAIDAAKEKEVTSPTCASCATANDADAAFCKRCGTALGAASR